MQQAGDTQTPVYGKGHGVAKLVAGALGGLVEGLEAKQQQDRLNAALKAGNDAAAGVFGGGTAPSAGGAPSAPRAPIMAGGGDIGQYARAIQANESGGNYAALGPVTKNGDRAHGAYQVMGANVGPWTQAALGRAMTPDEFRNDKAAQDATFAHVFGGYVNKYGPSGAAQAWFGGPGSVGKGGQARDILGTSGNDYVGKFNRSLGTRTAQADMPVAGGQPVEFNGGPGVGFFIPPGDGRAPPSPAAMPAPVPTPPMALDPMGTATGFTDAPSPTAPMDSGAAPALADMPAAPAPMPSPTVADAVRKAALAVGQDNGTDPAGTPGLLSPSFAPVGGESVNGLPSNSFGGPVFTPQAGTAVPLPPARPDAFGAVPSDAAMAATPPLPPSRPDAFGAVPSDMAMAAVPPLPPGRPAGLGVDPRADMPAPGAQQVMLPGNLPPGAGLAQLPGAPMMVSNPLPASLFGGSDPATTGSVTPDNHRLAEALRRSDPMNSTDAGAGDFARSGMGRDPKALAAAVANYQPGQAPATPAADPRRLAALVDPQGAAARAQAAQNAPQAASVGAPSVLPPNAMGGPAPGPNGPVTAQAGGVGGVPINMGQISALAASPNPAHQALAKGLIQRFTEGRKTSVVGDALVDGQTGQVIYRSPGSAYTLNPGDTRFGADNRPVAQGQPKDDRTGNQRDYEAARAGGFTGDFNSFLQQRSQRQGQAVTIKDANGSERTMFYDPVSNSLKTPEQMGAPAAPGPTNPFAPPGKQTEEQAKNSGYANRLVEGHNIITELEHVGTGAIEAAIAKVPGSNTFLSANKQRLEQAQRNFLTAILRRESGASISPTEFVTEAKKYFPQVGDKPENIEQKRRAREIAVEGVMTAAGPGYQPPASYQRSPPQGQPQAAPAPSGKIGPPPGSAGTAPPPTVQRTAPRGGPAIGTVEDGHVYVGGDPADPQSWTRAR